MSNHRLKLPRVTPTDEAVFERFNRRKFLKGLTYGGIVSAAAGAWTWRGVTYAADRARILAPGIADPALAARFPFARNPAFNPEVELTDPLVAGTHNNFYEFLPGGGGPVWRYTDDFIVEPWKVEVTGECLKPRTFDLDDLLKFPHEERVYHFRCVERWAMDVPWTGFELRKLLEAVEPTEHARHVRFVSAVEKKQMPGVRKADYYPWPYFEALRMDEAMNELAMIVMGIYGKPLPKQHGAPVRVIVPWKYGYKSPKSIVKIELTRDRPPTFWSQLQPLEYGYLSNVNPNIPHPRWSQDTDYMLTADAAAGRGPSQPTQIFNGYAEQVARLYPDEPTTPQPRHGGVAR